MSLSRKKLASIVRMERKRDDSEGVAEIWEDFTIFLCSNEEADSSLEVK